MMQSYLHRICHARESKLLLNACSCLPAQCDIAAKAEHRTLHHRSHLAGDGVCAQHALCIGNVAAQVEAAAADHQDVGVQRSNVLPCDLHTAERDASTAQAWLQKGCCSTSLTCQS